MTKLNADTLFRGNKTTVSVGDYTNECPFYLSSYHIKQHYFGKNGDLAIIIIRSNKSSLRVMWFQEQSKQNYCKRFLMMFLIISQNDPLFYPNINKTMIRHTHKQHPMLITEFLRLSLCLCSYTDCDI